MIPEVEIKARRWRWSSKGRRKFRSQLQGRNSSRKADIGVNQSWVRAASGIRAKHEKGRPRWSPYVIDSIGRAQGDRTEDDQQAGGWVIKTLSIIH